MSLTDIATQKWLAPRSGYRVFEQQTLLGSGEELWEQACSDLMSWQLKTRSGFTIYPQSVVTSGSRPGLSIEIGPIQVIEPIEVCDVLVSVNRVGYAYKTLDGHPVSGEEAFILQRLGNEVFLVIRSLTAPAKEGTWRRCFPLLLVAQRIARWRYQQALKPLERVPRMERLLRRLSRSRAPQA